MVDSKNPFLLTEWLCQSYSGEDSSFGWNGRQKEAGSQCRQFAVFGKTRGWSEDVEPNLRLKKIWEVESRDIGPAGERIGHFANLERWMFKMNVFVEV